MREMVKEIQRELES
jgi:hypothetical protein